MKVKKLEERNQLVLALVVASQLILLKTLDSSVGVSSYDVVTS
jgi:hypothetical protein